MRAAIGPRTRWATSNESGWRWLHRGGHDALTAWDDARVKMLDIGHRACTVGL